MERFRVDDGVGDLVRLLRHQAAPDGVALRPGFLALVVKTLRVAVDHDAEHDAVEPGGDAAVELGRARVDRHRMALRRIADRHDVGGVQHAQHIAAVIGRAANEEIVGGGTPVFLQPFDIGFEAAAGRHQRLAADGNLLALALDHRRDEKTVSYVERDHRRIVDHADAELLGAAVEVVERAAAAAEEEGVGLAERQRAAERRLKTYALLVHPAKQLGGVRDREFCQHLVGLPAGDAVKLVEEFLFGVRAGHGRRGAVMGAAQIAGVAGIATAVEFRRAFDHDDAAAGARSGDGGTQRGIAAAGHHHVEGLGKIRHGGHDATASATRAPKAPVPSLPPRSGVRVFGSAITRSSALSIACAAPLSLLSPRRSPSQASSIAAEPISEDGLARFLPAMSGAEPCCACATPWSAPALSEAARPRLPAISLASSDRMSPYMLVVTTTSNWPASRTSSAAMASMMRSSYCTCGYFAATARVHSRYSPSDTRSTLALCTQVTFLRRCIASLNADSAMRVEPLRVILRMAMARSGVGMNSPGPTCIERSA